MIKLNFLSTRRRSNSNASGHSGAERSPDATTQRPRNVRRVVLGLGLAAAVALPLATPNPALAWWQGGVWVGGPAYVAPPPYTYYGPPPAAYYAPPPVVYAPPVARWIPGHYNWRGFWIPGHWAG